MEYYYYYHLILSRIMLRVSRCGSFATGMINLSVYLRYGDICDGSESNNKSSGNVFATIDLCPHNYVDICDDSGSVNRNFDDGFSAIELCQHDEASCDDSKVGIPLAASKLVNDDTTPSTLPLPTQQSCQYCGIMCRIQGKGGNPCKIFFPLFMHLIE